MYAGIKIIGKENKKIILARDAGMNKESVKMPWSEAIRGSENLESQRVYAASEVKR